MMQKREKVASHDVKNLAAKVCAPVHVAKKTGYNAMICDEKRVACDESEIFVTNIVSGKPNKEKYSGE
jgi:hypothetical protein